MIRVIVTVVGFSMLAFGCVSMVDIEDTLKQSHNIALKSKSQFDNTTHVRMSNMYCTTGTGVMFGLYQDTKQHNREMVLLKAGSHNITNIDDGESLLINLDGSIYKFKTHSTLTNHDKEYVGYGASLNFSNKVYFVPEEFIRKVATAKSFSARVYLLNDTYIEGKCSPVTYEEYQEDLKSSGSEYSLSRKQLETLNRYTAQQGFQNFVRMIDATKW